MENIEQFKPFPLNEKWLVGNLGSIMKPSGGYAKQSNHSLGYKSIKIDINGEWKTLKAHRVVAITWILNPENKRTVNHMDADKTNNAVYNLEWMTMKEQIQHAHKIGCFKNVTYEHLRNRKVSDSTRTKMSEAKKGKKRAGYRGAWL